MGAFLKVAWPFSFIVDFQGHNVGWALINGPIVTCAQQDEFATLRRAGYRFAGMSSYMTFPAGETRATLDYDSLCEVWCHCFRNPASFLPANVPRALISMSDFTDYYWIAPHRIVPAAAKVDFLYVGAMDDWKRVVKGWSLAACCVPRICQELDLHCLVIGAPAGDFESQPGITFSAELPWTHLLARLAAARFLFVPNMLDPSPRLIAEALCLNAPVVMNREILGGWKYVNRFTGTFFDGEHDVVRAVRACLTQAIAPRAWFSANYGPYLSGQRLVRLLRTVDPAIARHDSLWIAEPAEHGGQRRSD
jgi:hypothetical protein